MQHVNVISHPLLGSSLIEASAGTGKTWTITALYLRLILGMGSEGSSYERPLSPREILVMTFTRAATRELVERIQKELLQAADCFSMNQAPPVGATFASLWTLMCNEEIRRAAALRLRMAAECMDESAVLTIDAWCQRMLHEHAFTSGASFDEEVLIDERALAHEAVQDTWRWMFYSQKTADLEEWLPEVLNTSMDGRINAFRRFCNERQLLLEDDLEKLPVLSALPDRLTDFLAQLQQEISAHLMAISEAWSELQGFLEERFGEAVWPFHNGRFNRDRVQLFYVAMNDVVGHDSIVPAAQRRQRLLDIALKFETLLKYLSPDRFVAAINNAHVARLQSAVLQEALRQLSQGMNTLLAKQDWASGFEALFAQAAYRRLQELKKDIGRWGFADVQRRLLEALERSPALIERIRRQFPVALVDEYQDTSQIQYQLFRRIYPEQQGDCVQTGGEGEVTGKEVTGKKVVDYALILIGDPKQSIYGFRGADIQAYLAAKQVLPETRRYSLPYNFRSTAAVVNAVNTIFVAAEQCWLETGAFNQPKESRQLLSFIPVAAQGALALPKWMAGRPPLEICLLNSATPLTSGVAHRLLAGYAAQAIQAALHDGVSPQEIAVLVRQKSEADLLCAELRCRGLSSVYLSERDSVWDSEVAADLLRWLQAAAAPQDLQRVRAAVASALTGLVVPDELQEQLLQEDALESWMRWFMDLHQRWSDQGVLAMLDYALQSIRLRYPDWLAHADAERWLTDVQHLAELAQEASLRVQGMQALLLWYQDNLLAGQDREQDNEAPVLRMDRTGQQIRVLTIHKSKGLEFAWVFLPFMVMYKKPAAEELENLATLQEDIRLLYVALTRAKYTLWLGIANQKFGNANASIVHKTGLGYLLGLQDELADYATLKNKLVECWQLSTLPCQLHEHAAEVEVPLTTVEQQSAPVVLQADDLPLPAIRPWQLSSYSRLLQQLSRLSLGPTKERDEPEALAQGADAWPAGRQFGERLHQVLELWGRAGFTTAVAPLVARCFRATPWREQSTDLSAWVQALATVPLPGGASLAGLSPGTYIPEMEFYLHLPESLLLQQLDAHCRSGLLGKQPYLPLQIKQLQGMLTGVMDLVFEHAGRYWIVDYKSNRLPDYQSATLLQAAAEHRYDVQAALYLLALHRHLGQRLSGYDPREHLGGYLLWFIRGHAQAGQGCLHWQPGQEWLRTLEAMMPARSVEEGTANV